MLKEMWIQFKHEFYGVKTVNLELRTNYVAYLLDVGRMVGALDGAAVGPMVGGLLGRTVGETGVGRTLGDNVIISVG